MAEGKKSRKFGRNKKVCETYTRMCREERNKKRTARRIERAWEKKKDKMLRRIKRSKPVPSKWLIRFADQLPL